MFANVFTKTTRERITGAMIGAIGAGIGLLFTLAVYRDVDISFYFELPAALLELMGINADNPSVAGMGFGAMYDMIGAFVVAGTAIGIGASSIAGEEADGTFGFLLGNPVSRRSVLVSKAVSMVVVVGLMSLVMWGLAHAAAAFLDVATDGFFLGSMVTAMFLNGLVHGFLAMAIGAWTGHRTAASGSAVGIMVGGYLAASLLPLAGIEWLARVFPWYWFSASAPIDNGLDAVHVGVLVALSVVSFAIAWVGLERRDLRDKGTAVTLLDRLRANPTTQKVMERLAGSARVSRMSVKTASDHQGLLTVTGGIMFYMGVLIAPLYNFIPEDFINVLATFPDALIAMIGGVDMSTATGFLTGENFSLVGPIAVIVLMVVMGSRALAGEEEAHTMGLLLSNPIPRSRVILEKAVAMVTVALGFGLFTFIGTWIGVAIAGLDEVGVGGIAAVSFMLALFGLVFGGLALAVSAATGSVRVATMTTTGVALVTWFMFTFFRLSDAFEPWIALSPFEWFLGGDPLLNGADWGGSALLGGAFAVFVAIAIPLFQRRDLGG